MDNKSLVIASLIGGVASTVLSETPVLNVINCLLCAGFWLGPLLAVWIYRRQTGAVTLVQGIGIGTVAGIWAGILGFLIGLAGGPEIDRLMDTYGQMLAPAAAAQLASLGRFEVLISLMDVGFNIMFGALGGLVGGALFKTTTNPPAPA